MSATQNLYYNVNKMFVDYLVFNRNGPKIAPATHIGSLVWIPSTHFTVTSPENKKYSVEILYNLYNA